MRVFVETLRLLGAQPVVCDVFDRKELRAAVGDFEPDVIVSELTDAKTTADLLEAESGVVTIADA